MICFKNTVGLKNNIVLACMLIANKSPSLCSDISSTIIPISVTTILIISEYGIVIGLQSADHLDSEVREQREREKNCSPFSQNKTQLLT